MKSQNLIRAGVLTLAGSVGAGMLTFGVNSASANDLSRDQATLNKRELDAIAWVMDDNDDDDDTNSRTDGPSHDNTNSNSHDATNSRFTMVSRNDRDRSRGDLTRDITRDGGNRHLDKSVWNTNDMSRNDTRSKVENDNTNTRHTAKSRDRDRSRGDKTKDWTRDGGDHTRDRSANFTNDRSLNDTRR